MLRHCVLRAVWILSPCLGLGVFAPVLPATAQQEADSLRDTATAVSRIGAERARGPLVDLPVRRGEYRLGPGDGVEVSIFGDRALAYSVTVTPEGALVVPGMGVVDVLGRTIDEAEATVRALVYRYYRNVGVHLALSQVRTFKVFVLGAVPTPGVRTATATTRVSEVVPSDDGPVRRSIRLRRATGDTIVVDLLRFVHFGDLEANPTLREGDALIVPRLEKVVHVRGRVGYPGLYEHRDGESLATLLDLVTGAAGFPPDAADTIRLTRFVSPEQREFYAFSRAEAAGPRGRGFTLEPFDAIFVPGVSNFMEQQYATVAGQVRRPGIYPIRSRETTVAELVKLAGGFTEEASLVHAQLRRTPLADWPRPDTGDAAVGEEFLSPLERQVTRIRAQSSGSATVVVDFEQLFLGGQDAYDQPLQSGDELFVPRRPSGVLVMGAVPRPGIVEHDPEREVRDYVDLAGGFARRANRGDVAILRAGTGTRLDAEEVTTLNPGDLVIVPYREHRTLFERVQTAQTVIGALTSLILTLTLIRGAF